MSNKIVTAISSLLLGVLASGCASGTEAVNKDHIVMLWSQTSDALGNPYNLPDEISWAVDPSSCGDKIDAIREGFIAGQKFWSVTKQIPIHEAHPGEEINFVVYCQTFGKTIAQSPRAYRVKSIAVNVDNSIDKMEVEVPSNWKIVNDQLTEDGFTPMSYSAFGVAYSTLGLAVGMTHAFDPGRSSSAPNLGQFIIMPGCVKNCDT
jgi:hypothetical protein